MEKLACMQAKKGKQAALTNAEGGHRTV
jgi:hypothetical protein